MGTQGVGTGDDYHSSTGESEETPPGARETADLLKEETGGKTVGGVGEAGGGGRAAPLGDTLEHGSRGGTWGGAAGVRDNLESTTADATTAAEEG